MFTEQQKATITAGYRLLEQEVKAKHKLFSEPQKQELAWGLLAVGLFNSSYKAILFNPQNIAAKQTKFFETLLEYTLVLLYRLNHGALVGKLAPALLEYFLRNNGIYDLINSFIMRNEQDQTPAPSMGG